MRFTGKTVIITGGNKGIGEACALVFSRKGANVVIAARNRIDSEKLLKRSC